MLLRDFVVAMSFFAATAASASEWIKAKSANLELYTTAGERDARQTLETFEQVRDFFMRVKSPVMTTPVPVTIVGFRNAKEYKPYTLNEIASAYYAGDEQHDYIVMSGLGSEHTPTAIHEYMHLLVRHSGLELPVWLGEGFAELYSTLHPVGGQILLGSVPRGRVDVLNTEKWLPLTRLFAIDHESAEFHDVKKGGVLYAEAWLLTHMLALDDRFRDKFSAFAVAAAKSKSTEKALDEIYGRTASQIESDLRTYLRTNSLQGVLFKTKFEKVAVGAAEPATELEVGLTLAKLTMLLRHYDEATQRLEQLASQHKNSYEAEEALAYLYWRKQDVPTAREHMERATGLGAPGWKTWWDYARLLAATGERGPHIEGALRKTLELKPDMIDARLMLGHELYQEQRWEQALAMLGQVKNIDPERATRLFLTMAYASANINRKDEAKRFAADARKYARSATDRDSADRLIEYLNPPPAPTLTQVPARSETVARHNDRSVAETAADTGAPVMRRREGLRSSFTVIGAEESRFLTLKGRLKRFDCLGPVARTHVLADGKLVLLLVRNPNAITIRSGGGKPVDMTCGAQDVPVAVDYSPNVDKQHQTIGDVHAIEFLR
jgi:tetratricopeptide (TPR) repeat protein